MGFKPVGASANKIYTIAERTDSPIENQLLHYLLRHKVVLCKPGDEPQGAGIFITTQYPVGPYRADFLIIARGYSTNPRVWPPKNEFKFCIECDGEEFHSTEEQLAHDKRRDEYFKEQGIEVLRLSGTQIYKDGDRWAIHILNHLQEAVGFI